MDQEKETVYVVIYMNQYFEDGFEVGGVYGNYDEAEKAADNRDHAEYGWEYAEVKECPFHADPERVRNLVEQAVEEAEHFQQRRGNR